MVPKSEVLTISDSKEPVPKKPRRHTQKSVAKEALEVEASASAGSGGTGAEGRKKQKPKSFCAASTALTGVMLKQLLRNEQDTRTLCGVVFDTYIVSSQLHAAVGKGTNAGLTTTQCNRRAVVTVWDHRSSGRGRVWSKDSSRKERSWERYRCRSRITWKS